jgi:hypothetical protein
VALLKRAVLAICLAGLLATAFDRAEGHVGNRLRLGYRPAEPAIVLLAHLTEIYLEQVSGFSVDLKEYTDPYSLQAAIRGEEVDVAVEFPAEAWARTACPSRGALMENIFSLMKAYYRDTYGAVWVAAFPYRREGLACFAPSYVITRGVSESIAYYTLPAYLKKLAAAVSSDDLAGMLAKASSTDPKSVVRDWLTARKMI